MDVFWIVTDPSTGQLYGFQDPGQALSFAQRRNADEPQEVSPFTIADADDFLDSEPDA